MDLVFLIHYLLWGVWIKIIHYVTLSREIALMGIKLVIHLRGGKVEFVLYLY